MLCVCRHARMLLLRARAALCHAHQRQRHPRWGTPTHLPRCAASHALPQARLAEQTTEMRSHLEQQTEVVRAR